MTATKFLVFLQCKTFFYPQTKKLEQENRFSANNLPQKQPKNALFNLWLSVTFYSVNKKKVPTVKSLNRYRRVVSLIFICLRKM